MPHILDDLGPNGHVTVQSHPKYPLIPLHRIRKNHKILPPTTTPHITFHRQYRTTCSRPHRRSTRASAYSGPFVHNGASLDVTSHVFVHYLFLSGGFRYVQGDE